MSRDMFLSLNLSVVACRHPETGKLLCVKERGKRGWWLPAGAVDAGEKFEQAAIRECYEEAGLTPRLCGLLRCEHSVQSKGEGRSPSMQRMRTVFFAEPQTGSTGAFLDTVKQEADSESQGAAWMSTRYIAASAAIGAGHDPFVVDVYERLCKARGALTSILSSSTAPSSASRKMKRYDYILYHTFQDFPRRKESEFGRRAKSFEYAKQVMAWGEAIAAEPGCPLTSFGEHIYLRGSEPLDWAIYLDCGGFIGPLSMMQSEGTPVDVVAEYNPFQLPLSSADPGVASGGAEAAGKTVRAGSSGPVPAGAATGGAAAEASRLSAPAVAKSDSSGTEGPVEEL